MIESGTAHGLMYCSFDGRMCMSPSVYVSVLNKTCEDLSLLCFLFGVGLGAIVCIFIFKFILSKGH